MLTLSERLATLTDQMHSEQDLMARLVEHQMEMKPVLQRIAQGADQASAGLDLLSDDERRLFTELNERYKEKFAMPFIMAVKGRSKDEILAAFQARLDNDAAQEFATALAQIERIALLRLKDVLP